MSNDLYAVTCRTISGEEVTLDSYRDNVILVVNTASKCGFTPQYKGLEALHQKYGGQGLVVLGFPCNQFREQEPEAEGEIASFCEMNFGVSFPLFAKVDVNGDNAHPLFEILKRSAPGVLGSKGVKWNFTKFLVAPGGKQIVRFAPMTKPAALESEVVAMLNG
ncbi:glutathione peroxidase [Aestuariirhabdus sp. LZHN29]|uniref:glutathione peroxidase n=1 Tax=Aestuariirhabdus sp. LZHN29 TaxID=3417462 RepID=UPI003CF77EF1